MTTTATTSATSFLRTLPARLQRSRPERAARPRRKRATPAPLRSVDQGTTSMPPEFIAKLLERLDCTHDGLSLRTGRPSWPDSWPIAWSVVASLGGEVYLVHVIASWLERRSATTRKTYATQIRTALSDLRVKRLAEIVGLQQEAALTWLRERTRRVVDRRLRLKPRTINLAASVLNSLMAYVVSLDLVARRWVPLPLTVVNRGRHQDEDPVVLTPTQLTEFWELASARPRRQFLALILSSLHGTRVAEVAAIRWKDLRYRHRGEQASPAVINVIGKGGKHRKIQIHPSVRAYLERERATQSDENAFVLADASGNAPTPQQVSRWAKAVFRAMDLPEGYAHALRATWTTLALENTSNTDLQVQMSGGWSNSATMRDNYYKRRRVPLVHLFDNKG